MAIYTDGIHLISCSSEEELHLFARRGGIKRVWFHASKNKPHYDLLREDVKAAVLEAGAIQVSSREIVLLLKKRPPRTGW